MGSEKHLWLICLPCVGFILGLIFFIDGLINHSFKGIIGGVISFPIFLGLLIYASCHFFLKKEKKFKESQKSKTEGD